MFYSKGFLKISTSQGLLPINGMFKSNDLSISLLVKIHNPSMEFNSKVCHTSYLSRFITHQWNVQVTRCVKIPTCWNLLPINGIFNAKDSSRSPVVKIHYPSMECSIHRMCQDPYLLKSITRQRNLPLKRFVKIPVPQASMKRLRELTSALLEMPHFLVPTHGRDTNCSGSRWNGTSFPSHDLW